MANTIKHKTLPAGVDRPGFAGITPSLYAEEHAFAGGAHGSVLTRSTGTTDGASWIAAASGLLLSTAAATPPSFTASIPFTITTQAIAAAANNTYDFGSSGTKFKDGYFAGTLTAGTFSGSGASLTSIPAGNLTGTITSTVQDNITRTGTVASGTWSGLFGAVTGANLTNLTAGNLTGTIATIVQNNITRTGTLVSGATGAGFTIALSTSTVTGTLGLARGGTNADLSATGGSNQVLKQSSSGAAITVGTLASTNLSDSANIALLNAQNTFTAAVTGNFVQTIQNSAAGTSNATVLLVTNDANKSLRLDSYSSTWTSGADSFANGQRLNSNGAGGLSITASDVAGVIRFYTGGTNLRWGVNAAGDWTFGASSHIADSSGTPSIGTGWGTSPSVTGTDYAMKINVGSTGTTGGVINFGHTWSTQPICVGTSTDSQTVTATTATTTSAVTLTSPAGPGFAASSTLWVICRGF